MRREIAKLCVMNFFLGLTFLSPVAVFFYQQRGLDYFQILLLESILAAGIFLFEIPTGIVADRYGRKKAIVLATILLLLGQLIFLFAGCFALFAAAFAITGIAVAFLSGSVEALIYDRLRKRNKEHLMKRAFGSYGSSSLMGGMIAPIIGSCLAKGLFPQQFVLLIQLTLGAMFIAFIVSLLIIDPGDGKQNRASPVALVKEGIVLLRGNRSLMRIVLLNIFSNPFLFTSNYLSQVYFRNAGVEISVFGLIFAVSVLVTAVSQKYAYKFEGVMGTRMATFMATIVPGILYVMMAFILHPVWAIGMFVLSRVAIGMGEPLFSEYRNAHISSRGRATALSLISMAGGLYLMVMRLIIGALANCDICYSFVFMGAVIIAASILFKVNETHMKPRARKYYSDQVRLLHESNFCHCEEHSGCERPKAAWQTLDRHAVPPTAGRLAAGSAISCNPLIYRDRHLPTGRQASAFPARGPAFSGAPTGRGGLLAMTAGTRATASGDRTLGTK